jgi:hypothetical protein
MVRLSPKDSSILARVAQYSALPKTERSAIVKKSSSRSAKQAGAIILGEDPSRFSPDVQAVAKAYIDWAKRNRRFR